MYCEKEILMIICKHNVERGRNMQKYVIFKIENQSIGISTKNVEKILKLTTISKIPDSNFYVEGVINYQEQILPLINIKKLFNMSASDINENSSVIIVRGENGRAGIIVDEVDDIEDSNDDTNCTQVRSQYVEEVKILNGNITSILSPSIVGMI